MEISKTLKDKKMTVELVGRMDTTTAPELEKAMDGALDNVNELILDFKGMEYISSAGLRVLLALQKTMNKQGSMSIINVCDTINEVFEITGFCDVLQIVK